MSNAEEVVCRPSRRRVLWSCVGLGAVGVALAAVRAVYGQRLLDVWLGSGVLLAGLGIASLLAVTAEVTADAHGLRVRKLLRRRNVPWQDVADLRVRLLHANSSRAPEVRRVSLLLRNGRSMLLPLPQEGSGHASDFDATLAALRALHRRYGAPASGHLPVVSYRTAGRGWAGSLAACVLLLVPAGGIAYSVPDIASYEQAWQAATPCTAGTPAGERAACLTTRPAVVARTEVRPARQRSWLYFAEGRPVPRLAVSDEAAQAFRPGERVELTVWRGEVMRAAGPHHVWRAHVPTARSVLVVAVGLVLAAGYPGARVLLRLRGRRLPDDEVLPSALPFAGALVGTALWLLPLCYVHATDLLDSPVALAWAAVGVLCTVGMVASAWRATGVRPPGGPEGAGGEAVAADASADAEVFVAARFLEHTDYNPHHFGTHIVLGGGPLAVTPHAGPGRFAAKRIPVERLTVTGVRRPRGGDGDGIPSSWHIAELDDAGVPVRLAAAPADLARIIRRLSAGDSEGRSRPAEPRAES
ncbi:PH domain-containing protein [Streptomyces sp. RS10V-4]|uniref:PH domain-containing protein n=1 Tax=Streptomyces rhizoryzae TaxID=2932493 RepID=UPI00200386B0|nr:PH domain-containing protein [Streptomyces rhizoryzae]MCK7625888.1 PH domain-containing protein [Streptomyces rhizoryzae]